MNSKACAGERLAFLITHSLCLVASRGCSRPRAWFGAPSWPLLQHVSSAAVSWLCSLSSALQKGHLLLLPPRPVRVEGRSQSAPSAVSCELPEADPAQLQLSQCVQCVGAVMFCPQCPPPTQDREVKLLGPQASRFSREVWGLVFLPGTRLDRGCPQHRVWRGCTSRVWERGPTLPRLPTSC